MESKSKLFVVWHSGQFQVYNQVEAGAWAKYHSISSNCAKMICCNEEVIESEGGDYSVMCVGYAIAQGHLKAEHLQTYLVVWHDGNLNKVYFTDDTKAWKKYEEISSNHAKCIFKKGNLEKSEGGDYKFYCIGSVMF